MSDLQKLTHDLYDRVKELEERPRAEDAMRGMLNYTRHFLGSMKNYTGEDLPFTQVEYDTLDKLINTTDVRWSCLEGDLCLGGEGIVFGGDFYFCLWKG